MREDFWISGPHGWKIRARAWRAANAARDIFLIHGYSEHSLRYEPLVEFFVNRGFNITALDLPGHGESEGPRSSINSFEDYLVTLDHVHSYFASSWIGRDIFCFAHSLGALVALRYLESRATTVWKSVACSSPLLGLYGYPASLLPLLQCVAGLLPNWSWEQKRLKGTTLTHDEVRIQQRLADPWIKPAVVIQWVREILRARVLAFEEIGKISVPVALFQAGDERITDKGQAATFFKKLRDARGESACQWKEYENWYHELSNEIGRSIFYEDLLKWFNRS